MSLFCRLDNSLKKGDRLLNDKDLFKEILGRCLRARRNAKSIESIAGIADMDFNNLGRNERGEKLPNSYTLFKITRALNISVDDLFEEVYQEMEAYKRKHSK